MFLESRLAAALRSRIDQRIIPLPSHLAGIYGAPRPKRKSGPLRIAFLAFTAIIKVHLVFMALMAVLLASYAVAKPGATVLMVYRKFANGWNVVSPRWISYDSIPKSFKRMLVSVEDGGFWNHHGVELSALKYAYEIDKRLGHPMYGGSTLTMQLARTLFLVPEKWYIRKYLEIIIALEMDIILSKERQLELYFNFAEWGKGMFGVESASYRYYKTSFRKLGSENAIRLITLLSSPIRYNPDTLFKSKLLSERYSYLTRKYLAPVRRDPPPEPPHPETVAPKPELTDPPPPQAIETPKLETTKK